MTACELMALLVWTGLGASSVALVVFSTSSLQALVSCGVSPASVASGLLPRQC